MEVHRSAALIKMLTKIYLNTVPMAFLKWKTLTKIKQSDFGKFVSKTKKLTVILERYLKFKRKQAQRAFNLWKFQVKHNFPFYPKNSIQHKLSLMVTHENTNNVLTERIHGTKNAATIFDILLKLNDFREKIDSKFKKLKRVFFWKIRTYLEMEDMILNSKQPLLLRTLRLNEKNLFDNVRFGRQQVRLNPSQFMNMIDGKNMHEKEVYSPHRRRYFKISYFRNYMMKLRHTRKKSKSSSALLLTGVWGSNSPYLRFREYYICKLFEKSYVKKIYIGYNTLVEHRRITNYIIKTRSDMSIRSKRFSYTWSKVWLYTIMKDHINYICDQTLQRLEIHKRLCRLIEERQKMKGDKEEVEESKELQLVKKKDLEKLLEESLTMRLTKVQENFPKEFVHLLVQRKASPQETKRNLIGLLFDTVFYVLCDVIQQTQFYAKNVAFKRDYGGGKGGKLRIKN